MTPLVHFGGMGGAGTAVCVRVFAPGFRLCSLLSQYSRTLIRVLFVQNEFLRLNLGQDLLSPRPSVISILFACRRRPLAGSLSYFIGVCPGRTSFRLPLVQVPILTTLPPTQ